MPISLSPTDVKQTSFPVTQDVFLGGQLTIRQPKHGYRAGIDAVLLAAAVRAAPDGPRTLLDIGAGAGTVGLCAAARLAALNVVLLEREDALAKLAQENAKANGLDSRVRAVTASVTETAAGLNAMGLPPESFDQCVANPPFHDEAAGTPAHDALKSGAHAMPAGSLEDWIRFMARMVRPSGRATLIHKAEALDGILAAMTGRFGGLIVFPIFPRAGANAIRVIVEGTKGSRAPLRVRPGILLHEAGNDFLPEADAILRRGEALRIN
ncbi:MAG: tRNA1(Val) (adenine(37)-N6)-methyltransferase [Hyphomicrobium sp.]